MERQELLKELITNRKIERPSIKMGCIAFLSLIFILCVIFVIWLFTTTKLNEFYKWIAFFMFLIFFFEAYLRFVLVQIIKLYQRYAKEEIRRRCKCLPSCSEYAIISLCKIFPLVVAIIKIKNRLFNTCSPIKYTLDYPIKKDEEAYFLKYVKQNQNSLNNGM